MLAKVESLAGEVRFIQFYQGRYGKMVKFSRLSKVTLLALMILVLGAASAMAQRGRGGGDRGGGDRGRGGGFPGNMSEEDRNAMRERFQNMSEEDRNAMRERMMGGQGGDRGGFGGARTPQTADERWAMMARRYKEGFSDEEWKIVEPRLRPVVEKRREIDMLRMGGRFGGRGPGGGDAPETTASKLRAEISALRELLQKEDAPVADIKAKMTSIRALRKKAEEEQKKLEANLKIQRAKLREVLSIRQEARLFTDGVLD